MNSQLRTEHHQGKDMRIQDAFLNHCRRDKILVSMELFDSNSKKGQIVGFDNQAIILDDGVSQHLIYKNAVIAIIPQVSVNFIFKDSIRPQPSKAYPEYTADLA